MDCPAERFSSVNRACHEVKAERGTAAAFM
jgi:hypothetical protein